MTIEIKEVDACDTESAQEFVGSHRIAGDPHYVQECYFTIKFSSSSLSRIQPLTIYIEPQLHYHTSLKQSSGSRRSRLSCKVKETGGQLDKTKIIWLT